MCSHLCAGMRGTDKFPLYYQQVGLIKSWLIGLAACTLVQTRSAQFIYEIRSILTLFITQVKSTEHDMFMRRKTVISKRIK